MHHGFLVLKDDNVHVNIVKIPKILQTDTEINNKTLIVIDLGAAV